MPRKANPPAGWTPQLELIIKGYAESGFDWTEDTKHFSSQAIRNYASSRYYSYGRRAASLSPPRSTMAKSDKSSDELAFKMHALSLSKEYGIDSHNMHQLKKGIHNPGDILLDLVEKIPVGDGTTTDAALVVTHLYPLVHTLSTHGELIDSKTKENKATSAVIIKRPSLASIYTHKSAPPAASGASAATASTATAPPTTNMAKFAAKLKKDTGIKATATDDAITMAAGQVTTALKGLPDIVKIFNNLPTPKELGAKVGRMYDGDAVKPDLTYHTGHFNGNNGNKLKAQYIKVEFEYQGVKEEAVVFGFLIPIKGTESIYDLKSPVAAADETDDLKNFLGRGDSKHPLPTHSPISPIGDNITTSTSPRSSSTQVDLAEQAEVEKKAAEERHALKQREKIVEEKEVDMQDKLSHIREKEEELARRNALLEERHDKVAKQLQQVMERESHVEVSLVEMMEQTVALEDRERKLKESEIAATAAATAAAHQLQASLLQLEADKQQVNVEIARLSAERNDLAQKQEAVAAATTTTLVPLDQTCQNDKVHEYQSILIEQTHQQEVHFSSEDAEELHAKVTAQKQYKESVGGDLEDIDIGLAGGLLELQEDVDLQPNEQQSIVVYKSTPSISSKKVKKKALLSKTHRSSPKNTIKMQNTEKRMIRKRSTRIEISYSKTGN